MASRRNLIVVSNRGPVTFGRSGGERAARRGGGGLVTALRSLVLHHDVTWIASAMSDEDRVVSRENDGEAFEETARDESTYRLRLIAHDEQAYDWFYNVIANPTLGFLQHHLWDLATAPSIDHGVHHAWLEGYVPVNVPFADAVLQELYLDAHPEMHRRVGLVALLDPSRQEIPEYAEYVGAIQREARRVNDRFQQDGWVPIDLQISDNFPQAVAAYKQFDVLLVNAIFDGMNLIAKEAPLVNGRDGVL